MDRRLSCFSFLLSLSFASLLTGCSASSDSASSSNAGATTGGAQDNALAETQIANGSVPQADAITVEGVLNHYDLPLAATDCTTPLCVEGAYGIAPTLDADTSAVFVQLGLSSNVDASTFRRAPLNLAVVVDRSGSMSGTKIAAVRTALSQLIGQLGENDRLAIVLFDDRVDVLLPSTQVTDREALRALLPSIVASGATDMASGLRAGYAEVAKHAGTAGVSDRVMVLTDAETNTGDTDTQSFIDLASQYGSAGVGITMFGVGTDLNQSLVLAISRQRGGNYVFLEDSDKIATVFDTDFDYLVTPIAYDLKLRLQPASGFRVSAVYGYSAWIVGSSTVEIDIATAFLSRSHGAIVARVEPSAAWPAGTPPLAELALDYTTTDGQVVSGSLPLVYGGSTALDGDTTYYSQTGVRKSVALVNGALGMRRGCELYWQGRSADAHTVLTRTRDLLISESNALVDLDLSEQAAEAQELDNNMSTKSASAAYYSYSTSSEGLRLHCAFAPGRAPGGTAFLAIVVLPWLARGRRRRHPRA